MRLHGQGAEHRIDCDAFLEALRDKVMWGKSKYPEKLSRSVAQLI
jgi:hypothetical protein